MRAHTYTSSYAHTHMRTDAKTSTYMHNIHRETIAISFDGVMIKHSPSSLCDQHRLIHLILQDTRKLEYLYLLRLPNQVVSRVLPYPQCPRNRRNLPYDQTGVRSPRPHRIAILARIRRLPAWLPFPATSCIISSMLVAFHLLGGDAPN